MTPFRAIVFVLALWRLAKLFAWERGPFDIFLRLRSLFGINHTDDGHPLDVSVGGFPYLFTCLWCMSMLLAIPYAVLIYFYQDTMVWVALPLAFSAAAIAFDKLTDR